MNSKEIYTVTWKEMPIEDKLLLCMEYVCYLLMIGTLGVVIFAIIKEVILNAIIIFFAGMGFIACGLSARSTREAFLNSWNLNAIITNYLFKKNKPTSLLIRKI